MLAILFGCVRFHENIYGIPDIEVETDHKPLEPILRKPLHQAPARLQRMIIAIQKYPINVTYKPGKELAIADTLSRAFLPDTLEDYMYEDLDINFLGTMPISVNKLEQLKANTQSDCELQQLLQVVQTGWPDHKANLPGLCRPYWNIRDEISSYDGVLVKVRG